MGMTTDERYTNVCIKYLQMNMECVGFRDYIIERLNKYQKIQEIMNELNGNFYGSYLKDRQTLEKIYEVVENGNDD